MASLIAMATVLAKLRFSRSYQVVHRQPEPYNTRSATARRVVGFDLTNAITRMTTSLLHSQTRI